MAYNKKQHLRDNIEALRLVFSFDAQHLTDKEREQIRKYSGFGGLKCVLNPAAKDSDIDQWTTDRDLFPLVRDLHDLIRESSKDEREYNRYIQSMKSSILSAFYTPEHIVSAIGQALGDSEITPRRLLDPSAGTGIFPKILDNGDGTTQTVCVEQDYLTAKVLGALYPDYKIINDGFQTVGDSLDRRFDVVASNIPFGNFRVFDMGFDRSKEKVRNDAQGTIHSYYFVKGVDTLREGGVLAFITSQGLMDSDSNRPVREWLMQNCDLLSAVRLPNDVFKENAGTEVGTDLIILQKRSGKSFLSSEEKSFINTVTYDTLGIKINSLFEDGKNCISTSFKAAKDQYGKPVFVFTYADGPESMERDLRMQLVGDLRQRFDRGLFDSHMMQGNTPQKAQPVREPAIIDTVAEVVEETPKSEITPEQPEVIAQSPAEPQAAAPIGQSETPAESPAVPELHAAYQPPEEPNYLHYASVSYWREPGYLAELQRQAAERQQQPQAERPTAEPTQTTVPTQDRTAPGARPGPVRNLCNRGRGRPQKAQAQAKPDTGQLDLFAPRTEQNAQTVSASPPIDGGLQTNLFAQPHTADNITKKHCEILEEVDRVIAELKTTSDTPRKNKW